MYFGQVAIVYLARMHGTVALKHMHVMYFGQGAIVYLAHMHGTVALNNMHFGQDAIVHFAILDKTQSCIWHTCMALLLNKNMHVLHVSYFGQNAITNSHPRCD